MALWAGLHDNRVHLTPFDTNKPGMDRTVDELALALATGVEAYTHHQFSVRWHFLGSVFSLKIVCDMLSSTNSDLTLLFNYTVSVQEGQVVLTSNDKVCGQKIK